MMWPRSTRQSPMEVRPAATRRRSSPSRTAAHQGRTALCPSGCTRQSGLTTHPVSSGCTGRVQFGDLDMLEAHAVSAEIAKRLPGVVVSVLDYRLARSSNTRCYWTIASLSCGGWTNSMSGWAWTRPASLSGERAQGATWRRRRRCVCVDGDGPTLRAMCLAYPAVHRDLPPPSSDVAEAAELLPPLARFTNEARLEIDRDYLGDLFNDPPPCATPAIADLAGLPPVAIANVEHDDLRSSGEDFVRLLRVQDVVVEAGVPGVPHGYLNHVGDVAGADRTLERFVRHLRTHLA